MEILAAAIICLNLFIIGAFLLDQLREISKELRSLNNNLKNDEGAKEKTI